MIQLLHGDCLEVLKTISDNSIDCVITSPPYFGLRDYGVNGQIGLEETPEEYISKIVVVFREAKRVLKNEGTLWINIGDSYAMSTRGSGGFGKQKTNQGSKLMNRQAKIPTGLKPKDLIGIPWMLAFALRSDGWYLRQDIIWHKPNPMPESVKDRCTKSHEYVFLLSKSKKYYYDHNAIREPYTEKRNGKIIGRGLQGYSNAQGGGRDNSGGYPKTHSGKNKRSVWSIRPKPFLGAHFATFPEALVEPCLFAGCPKEGTVLDPFSGSGTVGVVAIKNQRNFIGIELNKEYLKIAEKRIYEADRLL